MCKKIQNLSNVYLWSFCPVAMKYSEILNKTCKRVLHADHGFLCADKNKLNKHKVDSLMLAKHIFIPSKMKNLTVSGYFSQAD